MSSRAIRRMMKDVQQVTGLSKRELREVMEAEDLEVEADRDVPLPATGPVNPLIRPDTSRRDC